MSDDDPEVRADYELRARTERERGRSRGAVAWTRPVFVEEWPCRVCKEPVSVTQEALDQLRLFNGMLARRGEPILRTTEIMYCDSCRAEFKRTAADRRRGQVERMRPVIQRLKRSSNPENERELIKQLEAWSHPDVPGLIQSIRDRIASKGRKPERGEV